MNRETECVYVCELVRERIASKNKRKEEEVEKENRKIYFV